MLSADRVFHKSTAKTMTNPMESTKNVIIGINVWVPALIVPPPIPRKILTQLKNITKNRQIEGGIYAVKLIPV